MTSVIADRAIAFIVPAIPFQVAHPPQFLETRKNIEFEYEFHTNSMGLRYRELPLEKQSDSEFRVVVLGDSFTEEMGVTDGDRFTSLLERDFSSDQRPAYFVNAGLAGAGPLQYGRILFTVGVGYHPDLVLIVLHSNDLTDTNVGEWVDLEDLEDAENGRFATPPPPLLWPPGSTLRRIVYRIWPWAYARLQNVSRTRDRNPVGDVTFLENMRQGARQFGLSEEEFQAWKDRVPGNLLKAVEDGQFNGALLSIGLLKPNLMIQALDIEGAAAEAGWSTMREILSDIVSLSRERGIACAVVYTPAAVQHDDSAGKVFRTVGVRIRREWLTERSELERRLEAWAGQLEVPYLSLTNQFRTAGVGQPGFYNFDLDGHWNANGHQLAAATIGAWLKK